MILLSFTESCKWGLVEIESLLMGAMNGLLDFESDTNDRRWLLNLNKKIAQQENREII